MGNVLKSVLALDQFSQSPTHDLVRKSSVRNSAVGAKSIGRDGAAMVLLVLLLPVVMVIASYAINLAYMEASRAELQIATDVATRAAGRTLAVTGDEDAAIAAAGRLLAENPVFDRTVGLSDTNLVFGVSTRDSEDERYQFGDGKNVNAVHLKSMGREDVPMLFPTFGVPIRFRPLKTAISTQLELDLAVVLDRSGSMAYSSDEIATPTAPPSSAPFGWKFGDPVPPNARWLDTIAALQSFMVIMEQSSHEEKIALSTYSSDAKVDVKLTTDYSSISDSLGSHSQKFDGGATNIGGGILAGGTSLSDEKTARGWASRVMIVMSDGIHNVGVDPVLAAKQVANEKIMIFTVTFSSEADQAMMEKVAEAGGGRHFHAVNREQLVESFREIAKSLPTLITF